MSIRNSRIGWLAAGILFTGCGGGTTTTDMASDLATAGGDMAMAAMVDMAKAGPTLVGTWKHEESATKVIRTRTLVFAGTDAAGDVNLTAVADYDVDAVLANCFFERRYAGKYTAAGGNLTVDLKSGTLKITDCTKVDDNKAEAPVDAMELMTTAATFNAAYTVTNTELTIGPTKTVFKRQ